MQMFNRDLNFLVKTEPKDHGPNLTWTTFIFLCAFIIVFGVMNFPFITGYIAGVFEEDNSESYNEGLADLYKTVYSKENTYSLPIAKGLKVFNSYNTSNNILATPTPASNTITNSPSVEKNYISIPKINVKAPIILATSADNKKIEKELKNGVVVYPGSALPGQPGTTVIVGHSSSTLPITKYSYIFSKLNKLEAGDSIFINFEGKTYVYFVSNKKTGSADSLASITNGSDLVLGSCWPVGSDKERIVVTASLKI